MAVTCTYIHSAAFLTDNVGATVEFYCSPGRKLTMLGSHGTHSPPLISHGACCLHSHHHRTPWQEFSLRVEPTLYPFTWTTFSSIAVISEAEGMGIRFVNGACLPVSKPKTLFTGIISLLSFIWITLLSVVHTLVSLSLLAQNVRVISPLLETSLTVPLQRHSLSSCS